ncbi:NADPH:quinone oxidoreductase family protein [Microbacterium caowuchunii]|uniref:NADPH:quinone oxidoreductase family protein n=1 Tax=Microbacterium caowuchunii TaxID=2614638 RepID=A0A5N0TIE4_9MICO|nr:NADPH:quinone oxidoreductase family protein [Microbacterium caowuchunii]KAA9134371.1 NADPH:quinone oxidoreductase family protein [Microbacterium caowuchunii]
MRAWHVTRHGEPEEVLELVDVPDPVPGPGEVLIRVAAVAANFPDVLLSRGEYQVRPPLPFTPGIELSGTVVAVGDGVEDLAPGQRVVGSGIGVLSELAVLPAGDVHPAPDALDDIAAAGLMIAYQTAWFGLHRRGRMRAGDWVLVHAAAGGVGAAAVQLAVAAGARVIGVVGSATKTDVARAAGAEAVLRRDADDIAARVKEITGGHGADVVFDPVGGAAFTASTKCIAFEGRLVVVGFASGEIPQAAANHALVKNYSIDGLHWALYAQRRPDLVREAHAELTRLAAEGAIRPVVHEVVPFLKAPAAIQLLAGGTTTGRIVIEVGT